MATIQASDFRIHFAHGIYNIQYSLLLLYTLGVKNELFNTYSQLAQGYMNLPSILSLKYGANTELTVSLSE